jgi:glycosyltransferase involved in cell wall biosynthesis
VIEPSQASSPRQIGPPKYERVPLRVLLVGPFTGYDPPSGDLAYTEALLVDPPVGVRYTTLHEALDVGAVRVRGRKPWHGVSRTADLALFAARAVELGARGLGIMFREQTLYLTVEEERFDLVHQHLFPVRLLGAQLPTVSSAGYPLTELYQAREGWGLRRLNLALGLEDGLARLAGTHQPWLRPSRTGVLTVYTPCFRDWLVARGVPGARIHVVGTALPDLPTPPRSSDGRTLGVVARDFHLKGGSLAVAVLRRLRSKDPSWRCVVATTRGIVGTDLAGEPGVEVHWDPPRSEVLNGVLPRVDVLLALTRSDCGAPYSVLEALHAGAGVVVSDSAWLDPRLSGPAVARVPRDPVAAAAAVTELLGGGPAVLSAAAVALWRTTFSMPVLQAELLRAYRQAIDLAGEAARSDC